MAPPSSSLPFKGRAGVGMGTSEDGTASLLPPLQGEGRGGDGETGR